MKNELIFVIGAGRSGTTILSDLIGSHPAVYKMKEKRYLWTYGAYWRDNDFRGPNDVSKKIRKHIANYLEEIPTRPETAYILDKTPSNCFRVGFLQSLYPEAKYIHIIRDGRDVAYSSYLAFYGEKSLKGLADMKQRGIYSRFQHLTQRVPQFIERFEERDLPLSGWMPYGLEKLKSAYGMVALKKPPMWGVRYPGYHEDIKSKSLIEVVANQWKYSVLQSKNDLSKYVPASQVIEVRYEDLIASPRELLKNIFDFMNLESNSKFIENLAGQITASEKSQKRYFKVEDLSIIESTVGDLLSELNYL